MSYDWDLRREEGELTSWRHGLYIKASVTYFSTSKHKEWALKWPKYLFLQISALGLVDFNLRWALHVVVYPRKSDALNACTCEGLIFYAFFWGTEVPGVLKLDLNFQAKETKSWFTQNCLSLVYILRVFQPQNVKDSVHPLIIACDQAFIFQSLTYWKLCNLLENFKKEINTFPW